MMNGNNGIVSSRSPVSPPSRRQCALIPVVRGPGGRSRNLPFVQAAISVSYWVVSWPAAYRRNCTEADVQCRVASVADLRR